MTELSYRECGLCPRRCGADRCDPGKKRGYCGMSADVYVASASLHKWEEPCISGRSGTGAVFFSGCSLGCVYCQNVNISSSEYGVRLTERQLAETIRILEDNGAETIDLVTPTHYSLSVMNALDIYRPSVPVVWNTGGYEIPDVIERVCGGYADVYLTDIKYHSEEIASRYSHAPDYFRYALASLEKAVQLLGPYTEENGIVRRGVIVRVLVLPGASEDAVRILESIKEAMDITKIRLSLMAQYCPNASARLPAELNRLITTFEYSRVLEKAKSLGYEGWSQDRSSASGAYLPDFNGKLLGGEFPKG